MFERFKRSRDTGAGRTATADRELDARNPRVDDGRFEGDSPGERDRGVVAGGGEADLAADRPFERDEMARGTTGDDDTALDRERARADLDRGDLNRGDVDRDDVDRDRDDHDHHLS